MDNNEDFYDEDLNEYEETGTGRFEDLKYNARFIGHGVKKMSGQKAFLLLIFMFIACFALFVLQAIGILPEYVLFFVLLAAIIIVLIYWAIVRKRNRM